jgi:hypothetical protein
MSEETISIPKNLFIRMSQALISVEKIIKENSGNDWVEEPEALKLLGCSKAHLYRLKGKSITYKAIGRKHQYNRKSIEKYNELMSA